MSTYIFENAKIVIDARKVVITTDETEDEIIPATVEQIWDDSVEPIRYDRTSGDGLKMNGYSSSWDQYYTPWQSDKSVYGMDITSAWSIINESIGLTPCGISNNPGQENDAVVECGSWRVWVWHTDNTWELVKESKLGEGVAYPGNPDDDFPSQNGCDNMASARDRASNNGYNPIHGISDDGYLLVKPLHSYHFHGYPRDNWMDAIDIKAVLVQQYARVINDDGTSEYQMFMGVDKRQSNGVNYGELATGKNKRITSKWQSFSCLAFGDADISKEEFIESNPPFSKVQ